MKAAAGEIATVAKALDGVTTVSSAEHNSSRHGLTSSFFYYKVQGPPSWLINRDLTDFGGE
jgi:hypothetical protein